MADNEASPQSSIPHAVELGAFSFFPTSSSTSKLDIYNIAGSSKVTRDELIGFKSGCRLAARYEQVLESFIVYD
jgi:hypothetical protein